MKPMLAAPITTQDLTYPLLVSPKLDGIRALVLDGQVVSRSLKLIPNQHVQQLFGRPELNGLDGELIVGKPTAPDVFQQTTSGVMSIEGAPAVCFHVFDDFSEPEAPFMTRLGMAQARAAKLRLTYVKHELVTSTAQLEQQEARYLKLGYEGLMARAPSGLYKYGRSTLRQGWLLKLKRFHDAEAEVLGVKELLHNANAAQTNALGYQERSHRKAGKVRTGLLGALVVRDCVSGIEFDLGTGFSQTDRQILWTRRAQLVGGVVKYKSQLVGKKEKPRFPVFLGFRDRRDL